jgi:acetyl esterase/lipase
MGIVWKTNPHGNGFMKYLRCIFSLGILMIAAGCTSVELAAVNLPSHFDSTNIIHDVSYGPETWQKLDIYAPADAKGKQLDVVVFLYGGRWTYGAKEDYRFIGSAFSGSEFITVIPDYSKYPQVHFPVFVRDGAKALAWIYDNIASYGGNAGRIHVMGHSAGAHIGALLAADARYLSADS